MVTSRGTAWAHGEVAGAAIESGAAMVLGSHPHWVQAVEFYEGGFIAYGLGSFVGGRLASIRFVPIQIEDDHQPRFVDRDTGRQILDRMFTVSDL